MKKINIDSLNRIAFRTALEEERERQKINREMVQDQIDQGIRFDGDVEMVEELLRLDKSFKMLSCRRKSEIEITDEEFMFLERMTKNQTIVSNSRINDWQPGSSFYEAMRGPYFMNNKGATQEMYDDACKNMIKYDEELKECMKELSKILGIEYDENLHI